MAASRQKTSSNISGIQEKIINLKDLGRIGGRIENQRVKC